MDNDDLKMVAFYEAGHAVAAQTLFGRSFEAVSVEPGRGVGDAFRETAGRWFTPGSTVDAGVRQKIEEETMRIFSGPLAAERSTGVGNHELSAEDDAAVMRLALIATEGDEEEARAYTEWLALRARRLLNRYDVWPSVRAVAEKLMEARTLSYEDALEIIERVRSEVHLRDIQDHPVLNPRQRP